MKFSGVTSGVKVMVRDSVLTLRGERPAIPSAERRKCHLSKRRYGAF